MYKRQEQKELGQNYYENINCGAANAVYAQKWQKWEEGGNSYGFNAGVVRLDLDSGEETVLIEGRRSSEEQIGYNPTIAKVSEDGRYVYIWRKPSSGSLSSDGVPFGAYDTQNNVWIECGTRGDMFSGDVDYEGIYDNTGDFAGPFGLAYRNGVAPNPKDSSQVAVNAGGDRMMYHNKSIVLADLENNTTARLSPEGQVTMTPSFSKDGKSVLYSAAAEIDDSLEAYRQNSANLFEDWFRAPHPIYRVETATGRVTQITDSGRFDFLPQELEDGSILFIRTDGKQFKLMKIKNGRETVLAEDLGFENEYAQSGFYGHFKSERILDIG